MRFVIGCTALAALAALALSCPAARADVIADWNTIALDTIVSSERRAERAVHALASVHVAMFEVMSFVEGGYTPRYLVPPPKPLGSSGEGVAAVAAHYVLSELYPLRMSGRDAALRRSLATLDPRERANAVVWGRALGAIVYATRPPESGAFRPADSAAAIARIAAVNRNLAGLIDAYRLKPIERARAHALASTVLGDIYAGAAP